VSGPGLFRASAIAALALHAALLWGRPGVHGGGDLRPHLRLIQRVAEDPGLYNVYPPAYHAIGALLSPLVDPGAYVQAFGWLAAAALIAAFRVFQRSAGLPDAAAALFAWAPYSFALTWCLPKIEVAGYACALLGLAALCRDRHVLASLALLAAFFVHTAAALFLGLCGGVLALARRDLRGLAALAVGSIFALPLVGAHLAAGCSLAQALLFSEGDYLRAAPRATDPSHYLRALLLANPIALLLAGRGTPSLLRGHREIAYVCAVIALLYANELWLLPFGARTTLDLVRGLTVFAVPVSIAAGVALRGRPRLALATVAASAVLNLGVLRFTVPGTCVSQPIDLASVGQIEVQRCMFRWRGPQPWGRVEGQALRDAPGAPGVGGSGRGAEPPQVLPDRGVEGPAHLQRLTQ
jgi:hypothetical protein